MVHAVVGHLLFAAQSAHDQTEGSHIEQVAGSAVGLAPFVHFVSGHECAFAHHVAKMAVRIACQTYKVYAGKLFLIVLCGTLIVLCAETLLLVLGIVVHAVFHRLQSLTTVGCRYVIDGQVGSQRYTITDSVVNVYQQPVILLCLNHLDEADPECYGVSAPLNKSVVAGVQLSF